MCDSTTSTHLPVFEEERQRLLSALGVVTAGGLVERIQPIGSTSVPGLAGSGCLDIGLSVWPFPVDATALTGLGYQPVSSFDAKVQRFLNDSGNVKVWLVSAESNFFEHAVLIRDFLRDVEPARLDFLENRPVSPEEKAHYFARILKDAEHWWVEHNGFASLETITAEFTGSADSTPASFPWYVSSGWALDLFLGRVTRVHRDVDIVVPFSHQLALQEHLLQRGWHLLTPLNNRLEPWPRYMQIQMPRHQIHAWRADNFIDLLLTEIEHGVWRYRRNPIILRNAERIEMKSAGGIPFLAPELVLLFKSKNTSGLERSQDKLDFERMLPLLEPERRAWLYWAILASDPENPWLKIIEG